MKLSLGSPCEHQQELLKFDYSAAKFPSLVYLHSNTFNIYKIRRNCWPWNEIYVFAISFSMNKKGYTKETFKFCIGPILPISRHHVSGAIYMTILNSNVFKKIQFWTAEAIKRINCIAHIERMGRCFQTQRSIFSLKF